jgi:DNA-binding LytR/AlgR family response regulator
MYPASVLIIDDDELYRLDLEMALSDYKYDIWLSTASSEKVFLKLQEGTSRPDVLLIDIRLKENQNGIALAERLKKEQIPFIFLTAFPEEAQFQEALKIGPSAYFVKPVKPLELHHAIQLAINTVHRENKSSGIKKNNNKKTLLLKDKDNFFHEVPIDRIYAVESYGNFLFFHTPNNRYMLRQTLKVMTGLLQNHGFIRIHRRYLIAEKYWEKKLPLGRDILVAGHKFPIGRTYRSNLQNVLKE